MSSRPQFQPKSVMNTNGQAGASMAADIVSDITIVLKLSLVSYAINWSGATPVGVISVEVSNDYSQNADGTTNNPGTWNTLPLSAPTAVTGNTGNGFLDIDANAGYAMRVRYTRASGTGTMFCIVNAKVA